MALNNLTADVYFGRGATILERRERIRQLTTERRRQVAARLWQAGRNYNMLTDNGGRSKDLETTKVSLNLKYNLSKFV